jgi:hypothetical protein
MKGCYKAHRRYGRLMIEANTKIITDLRKQPEALMLFEKWHQGSGRIFV